MANWPAAVVDAAAVSEAAAASWKSANEPREKPGADHHSADQRTWAVVAAAAVDYEAYNQEVT